MNSIGVHGHAASLGEKFVDLNQLVAAPENFRDFAGAWITDDIQGLQLRMARAAIRAGGLAADDIDALYWISAIPDNHLRKSQSNSKSSLGHFCYSGSWMQDQLGLKRAAVLGVSQQGCAGLFTAVRLACSQIAAEPEIRNVLLVAGDALGSNASRDVLFNVISDAACAVVISREGTRYRYLGAHQITKGALWDVCAKPAEIAASYFPSSKTVVHTLLKRLGLAPMDIDLVIPTGVTRSSWLILLRLWGVPENRCFFPQQSFGHTIQADTFLILKEAEAAGMVQPGTKILLFTFGFGSTWSAIVLEVIR